MPVDVDDSKYPYVVITFSGRMTDDEFERYLAETESIMERRGPEGPYAVILDARQSGMPTSKQARMQADYLARHEEALAKVSVGTVFVIAAPVIRGAMKAILWMQSMPNEHVVVESLEAAEEWARAKLVSSGVSVPEGLSITARDATG